MPCLVWSLELPGGMEKMDLDKTSALLCNLHNNKKMKKLPAESIFPWWSWDSKPSGKCVQNGQKMIND
jgi:hypothetical protein